MRTDAKPYLVPLLEVMHHRPWSYLADDEWTSLPDELLSWDGHSDIHLRAPVSVDLPQLRDQTLLPFSSVLLVGVHWRSSSSGMVESAPAVPLAPSGDAFLEVRLPGDRIGGSLEVVTTVTLGADPGTGLPGVAHQPGSVLLESAQKVLLEPPAAMFPVHDLDFAAVPGLDDHASWHLEMSTELASPFLGTCRLLINRRDQELLAAVRRGRRDPRQEALLDDLTHGVAQVMLEMAIRLRETVLERERWPEGTVGEVLCGYLATSDERLQMALPDEVDGVPAFRTRLAGATRALGHGRPLS